MCAMASVPSLPGVPGAPGAPGATTEVERSRSAEIGSGLTLVAAMLAVMWAVE
jgi:hypothetical protein